MRNKLFGFYASIKNISNHYEYLIDLIKNHQFVGIVNEWIVDNYPRIVESKNAFDEFVGDKANKKNLKKYGDKLYRMMSQIIIQNDYKFDYDSLIKSISKYQLRFKEKLTYTEISLIKIIINVIVINEISKICSNERYDFSERSRVDEILSTINLKNISSLDFFALIQKPDQIIDHPVFLEYFYQRINMLGGTSKKLYKQINDILEDNRTSLKAVINNVHQDQVEEQLLIVNLFKIIKLSNSVVEEQLIETLSLTENELESDPYYKEMDVRTKYMYRDEIVKQSKKKKIKELAFAKKLTAKGQKNNCHIGFYLFKKPNYKLRSYFYVFSVAILTIAISILFAPLLTTHFFLGFFLFLGPISEIIIQLTNRIITSTTNPHPLPKMDYLYGIPADSATMVVIPTIVKNKEKVDKMFSNLEQYLLVNKQGNLYFTLLGDACECKTADYEKDQEIMNYGLEKCKELNKKYNSNLFYFAYRKRLYSKSEGTYLGWERKRGGLLHFNKLLLKTFSKDQIKEYFRCENLSKLKTPIKYVITIDADSELILNSACTMIGTMAHPLNQPVIDSKHNVVSRGFGILQPKVNVDIESTNKSPYVKLFGGLGGFDTYNPIVANFYQDTFNEGSFMGKGIYDLNVFQSVLENRFPTSLVLSHDLLESNYLHSGFLGDVEMIDDFPSKFLTDMTRQSRWARGDTQTLPWLFSKVKNGDNKYEKNPTSLLGRWKIFDNLRRMFLDLSYLLILITCLISIKRHASLWVLFIIGAISLPIIFYLFDKMKLQFRGEKSLRLKPYKNLILGINALISQTMVTFIIMPYKAWLYLTSFVKSLYRMIFSKKHLLSWLTAEEAEKTVKNTQWNYIKNFKINYLFVILLIVIVALVNPNNIIVAVLIGATFMFAPLITYDISQDTPSGDEPLKESENKELFNLAKSTWKFFEDNLNAKNHYLIPDNYQNNREFKADTKTSPTDIAFSITSTICAYKMSFINRKKCLVLLNNIFKSVYSLKKWNGHLYNWYSTLSCEVLYPQFISSVDSGNFVAALITLKGFLIEEKEYNFSKHVEKMITDADFSKFYTKEDVFSIGYNSTEGELSVYNYNKFASESRLMSFVAIAKGDVPSKHWFCLDKTLTKFRNRKGLASWSGSLFEYYMPLIFMRSYPTTLLAEAYDFAYFCQKEYMEEIDKNLPWGISECAYDELDAGINYKYKIFSIPYLKAKQEINPRIVISPYSSMLVLQQNPKNVYLNYKKFDHLNMLGNYGLYESFDTYTNSPVLAYFAHHQGMILASIANYLDNGLIQNYFEQDSHIKANSILTKEKIQIKPAIDIKIDKYKKFSYEKESIANDMRYFTYISSLPEVSVLSNSKYTVLMNDRGNGFSRYKEIQLNRYRKVTELDYGMFLYLKDLSNNKFWSNTYSPINKKPEKYEVVFALDKIKYVLTENDIITTTEVIVSNSYPVEIRKVTIKNISKNDKDIELTTYTEPTITENQNDVGHRTFNSLFISCDYDKTTGSLIMKKKLRNNPTSYYLLHRLIIKNPLKVHNQFETIKSNFLGENRSLENPSGLHHELSNSLVTPIDPIMSIRNSVHIPKNESVEIYLVNTFGTSRDQVIQLARSFDTKNKIEKAFEVSNVSNIINTKALNVSGEDLQTYNIMLNYLYQTSRINVNDERVKLLTQNALSQENLWKFGISGDRPIIVITINDMSQFGLIKDILKAYEFFKTKGIYVDVVIINEEVGQYEEDIKREVDKEIYRMNSMNDFSNTSGKIFQLDGSTLTNDEKLLLNTVSRLKFDTNNNKSLKACIDAMQSENFATTDKKSTYQKLVDDDFDTSNLTFYNEFGGFHKNGKEYITLTKNTPTPWTNVISNPHFGTLITNSGCGFTYAENSQAFKLTSWTNDISSLDQSEGIKINNEKFNANICIHGFGYSKFISKTKDFEQELTEFVAHEDPAKIYILKLKNRNKISKNVNLDFWINPVLGTAEEKTSRYILSEFYPNENALHLRNVYNKDYGNITASLSSSEKITSVIIDKILLKSISHQIKLKANETKEIVFILASHSDLTTLNNIITKFNSPSKAKEELKLVINDWDEKLGKIQVSTPDIALNYVLNGWYLYQTLSSRIMARAGFYQVSGAFGYRDQLQDSTNLSAIYPEITKNQIIENAKHQFIQGDVLHWWLEKSMFGLRSRYKDDYLWLIYAVSEYIIKTGDNSILSQNVPFIEGDELRDWEEERGLNYRYSDKSKPLYEHLMIIIDRAIKDFGEHGLPKMGGGDWNDGMNKIGIKGKGESVWLGFFLYDMLNRFIKLTKIYSNKLNVANYELVMKNLKESLNTSGWDKDYYLRAYFDNGALVGSQTSDECKIDLISQSFSILTDVADKKRSDMVLNAVKTNLVDEENKIVKLLTPPFQDSPNYAGYIQDYPKGIRENGGQYTHSAAWYIMALLKHGDYTDGYETYSMINPINRTINKDCVKKYKTEPYVIAADIYSNHGNAGRGGWTWYTGSSGWFYKVGIEEILGIKKSGNELIISPKIETFKEFSFIYKFLTTTYHVKVNISDSQSIEIDGDTKNKFMLVDDGKIHEVKIKVEVNK